jgi:diaminohydroxyphosphoribosylaminopyrimidine deaminase/5-amino-6-(5-phosphoribosylamino)uracil reductase
MRNLYDAILVGVETVIVDNPKLTVRLVEKVKNPIRIVLDTHARTPVTADVLKTKAARTIVVVGPRASRVKLARLQKRGAEILIVKASAGRIDIKELMKKLGQRQITSVLIEGGGEVAASVIEAGEADKAYFFIVPKIFGGRDAKTPVEGEGVRLPSQAVYLKDVFLEKVEEDFLVSGYLR